MKELEKTELLEIQGGLKFSASLLSSVVRGVNSLLELGRSIGTAIRRISTGRLC